MITQERLKFLFDLVDGRLIRKFKRGKAPKGTSSFSKDRDGYLVVGIDNKLYRTHRLIWLYVYGEHPIGDIDHINRDKTDNRPENLRCVTKSQNKQNMTVTKKSKSGIKGVYCHSQTKKWVAEIQCNYVKHSLGCYLTKEEAEAAYKAAAKIFHTMNAVVQQG